MNALQALATVGPATLGSKAWTNKRPAVTARHDGHSDGASDSSMTTTSRTSSIARRTWSSPPASTSSCPCARPSSGSRRSQ